MTLTNDELTDLTTGLTGGDEARRQPITDVNAWLDGLEYGVRPALRALGELLIGVAEREGCENADRFIFCLSPRGRCRFFGGLESA
ncbi:hypothetical protein [Mycobacterium marinum]|uniref:hypothetical protein n=1 Tax=Mycobacterium marinum TaxID=1781 RepID=UPI0023588A62|nr:hypothetical protein [Mycobacterium marinum]MDC9008221.1 hypothetical protein [Mycobacterium marinum]